MNQKEQWDPSAAIEEALAYAFAKRFNATRVFDGPQRPTTRHFELPRNVRSFLQGLGTKFYHRYDPGMDTREYLVYVSREGYAEAFDLGLLSVMALPPTGYAKHPGKAADKHNRIVLPPVATFIPIVIVAPEGTEVWQLETLAWSMARMGEITW